MWGWNFTRTVTAKLTLRYVSLVDIDMSPRIA